jgi:carboxylesterase type B
MYYFDHYDPSSGQHGAGHGDEIAFVFGNFMSRGIQPMMSAPGRRGNLTAQRGAFDNFASSQPTAAFKQLSNIMGSYWVDFARSGDPNGADLPLWPPFSEKNQAAMIFGPTTVGAKLLPNLERLKALEVYYARRRREVQEEAGAGEHHTFQ